MRDDEFTALDPPAAREALRGIPSEDERTRLKLLYAKTRGMLVDGTGWRNPVEAQLKNATGAENLVRPFGAIGSVYRVNGVGLFSHRLNLGLVGVGMGAMAWARVTNPSITPAVFVGFLAVSIVLVVLTVINGEKVARSPPSAPGA